MTVNVTVEDGSGLDTANSYVSGATADAYHVARNNTAWAALTDAQKTAALLYATALIDAQYSFNGYISRSEQALSWPRLNAQDDQGRILTGVPQKIKDATCELALVHATTEALNTTYDRAGAVESEKVGPVAVTYFQGAPPGVSYPFLDKMLSSVTTTGAVGVVALVRA